MHPLVSPGQASEQARGARFTSIHNATSNAAAAIAATAAADTRLAAATTCTAFSSSNRAPTQYHHHHHLCFIVSIIRTPSRPSGQLGRPLKCSSQTIASPALQHRTYSRATEHRELSHTLRSSSSQTIEPTELAHH